MFMLQLENLQPRQRYFPGGKNVVFIVIFLLFSTQSLMVTMVSAEDDQFEENDTKTQAAEIFEEYYDGLSCSEDDDDWYKVFLNQGDNLTVTIYFDGGTIDLDMLLEDESGEELDYSEGVGDEESVRTVDVEYTGYYYTQIYSFDSEGTYDMEVIFAVTNPEGIMNVEQTVFNDDDDTLMNDAFFGAHIQDDAIAGVDITIYDRDSGDEIDQGSTGGDGEWVSRNIANGDYRWEAMYDGEMVDHGEFDVSTGIFGRNIQGYGFVMNMEDDQDHDDLAFWTYDNNWDSVEGEEISIYYQSNHTLYSSGTTDEYGDFIEYNLPEENFTFTIAHNSEVYNTGFCYIYPPEPLLPDDSYEENDEMEEAFEIMHGLYEDMFIQDYDEDWYWIHVAEGDCLRAIAEFDHTEVDINMVLRDEDENEIDYSSMYGDFEGVFAEDLSAGRYYLELYCYGSGNYTLEITNKTYSNQRPMWYFEADDYVTSVAISTDGEYIVSGGDDEHVRLFHRDSDAPKWTYDAGDWVNDVAISAGGEFVGAACGRDLHLFGRDSNEPLWSFEAVDEVVSLDISSDGNYIVAGSWDNNVYFFERSGNGDPKWSYATNDEIESVAISGDGASIVAGSSDESIYVFDKDSSVPEWTYDTGDWVETVDISSNGEYICANTWDKLFFFERDSNDLQWSYESVDEMAISGDGRFITAGGWDGMVHLFDRSSGDPLWSFFTLEGVESVDISENGNYILAGNDEGKDEASIVFLLDRENGEPLWQYVTGEEVNEVSISGNGSFMTVGSDENRVYLFTASTNIFSPTIQLNSPGNGSLVGASAVNLEWEASDGDEDSISYDVYLDTSPTSLNRVSRDQSETSYMANDLETGVTYYWQVVAFDGEHESPSDVWEFTTDYEGPVVMSSIPQTGEEGVFVDSHIDIEFSESMNWSSVNDALFADFIFTTSHAETSIMITPAEDLAFGTQYSIDFNTDPSDEAGNPLQDWNPITFTTEYLTTSIQTPDMNAIISQAVTIMGTANPMADTIEIQFTDTWIEVDSFENGYHGGERNSGEWRYQLDCTLFDDGAFTFKVRCRCGSEYSEVLERAIVISNNLPPEIKKFSIEKDDYTKGESIQIAIMLHDSNGIEDIVSAEIRLLDGLGNEHDLIPLDPSISITKSYDLPELDIGDYSLQLVVEDTKGAAAEKNVEFKIKNAIPEIVSVNLGQSSYQEGETIGLTAMVQDADGFSDITKIYMEVLDGTGMVRTTFQLPLQNQILYSFTSDVGPGTYILMVHVEDSEGEVAEEAAILTITEKTDDGGDDELDILLLILPVALGGSLLLIGLVLRKRSTKPITRYSARPAQRRLCPTCEKPVRFIQQNRKWYCDNCGKYVVQRKPHQEPPKKNCPQCGSGMTYAAEYKDHYCWECEEYLEDIEE